MRAKRPTLLRRLRIEAAAPSVPEDGMTGWDVLFGSREWKDYRAALSEARTFVDDPPRRELTKSGVFVLLWYAVEPLLDTLGNDLPDDLPEDVAAGFDALYEHAEAVLDGFVGWSSKFTRLPQRQRDEVRQTIVGLDEWLTRFEMDHRRG